MLEWFLSTHSYQIWTALNFWQCVLGADQPGRGTNPEPATWAGPSRAGAVRKGGSRTARTVTGWRAGSNPAEAPESPAPPSRAGHSGRPQSRSERSWTAGTVSETGRAGPAPLHPADPGSAVLRPGETLKSRPLGSWTCVHRSEPPGLSLSGHPPRSTPCHPESYDQNYKPKDLKGTHKFWGHLEPRSELLIPICRSSVIQDPRGAQL